MALGDTIHGRDNIFNRQGRVFVGFGTWISVFVVRLGILCLLFALFKGKPTGNIRCLFFLGGGEGVAHPYLLYVPWCSRGSITRHIVFFSQGTYSQMEAAFSSENQVSLRGWFGFGCEPQLL